MSDGCAACVAEAKPTSVQVYSHEDGRECLDDGGKWRYATDDRGGVAICKRKHNIPERIREAEVGNPEPEPGGMAVLDFPEAGIRWPVPALVADALNARINSIVEQVRQDTIQSVLASLESKNQDEGTQA